MYGHLIPLSLYGPLFYFYIKTISTNVKLGSKDILHLIPFFNTLFLYGGFYFLNPAKKIEVFNNKATLEYIINIPFYAEILTSILMVYSIVIFSKVKKRFNETNELRGSLIINSISFICFAVFYCIYYLLVNLSLLIIDYDCLITVLMSVSLAVMTYFVYTYPRVVNDQSVDAIVPFIKYKTTGLNSEISIELKNRLRDIMKKERPYLDSDLRLGDLAQKLDVNRSQASQVINEHFDLNFFDFINKYRIQEAERLLLNSNLTISEIAYQSGFNNKVSFYKSFKKYKKITPLQLRENILLNNSERNKK